MHAYAAEKIDLNVLKQNGFKQDGYESILRFDTWKEQKCHNRTVNSRVKVLEIGKNIR